MDYIGRKVHVLPYGLRTRTERVRSFHGEGKLSSKYPSALTTVDGVPVSAQVLVRWRSDPPGQYGDGALVATTMSSPAGEWEIIGLNSKLRYDVSARYVGENDALQSNVQPYITPRFSITTINATVGAALDVPLPIEGGAGTVTAAYVSGTYPTGVTLSAGRLQASAVGSTAGTYTITYDLTDSIDTYTHTLDIVVRVAQLSLPRPAVPEELAIGDTVSAVFAATGGVGPYTYSLESGTLPSGLSFNASTATLSGTTTAGGTGNFQIKSEDADGREAFASFRMVVALAAHRFWRVLCAAADDNAYCVVSEVEFNGVQATGGTATASSIYGGAWTAAGAFDGVKNTDAGWSTATGAGASGAWIAYEYASALHVNSVSIYAGSPGNQAHAPRDFSVQSSDDGVTWTTEWSVTGATGWLAYEQRTFPRP